MSFNYRLRPVTLYLVVMLLLCTKSFGQTCSNVSISLQGLTHFGANGGSFQVTVTAGERFFFGHSQICDWSVTYPTFIHITSSQPNPPGASQAIVTFTVDQNLDLAPRNGNVVFIGQDNSQNPRLIINQDAASGDFALSASSGFATITKGYTVSFLVSIIRSGGFVGVVCLSASGLPDGTTASFSSTCTTGNSSVMTLTTSGSTPVGSFVPAVIGQNTTVFRSATAPFVVNDFSLSFNPNTLVVVQGGSSASAQVTINPVNGFSGPVNLGPVDVPSGVGFNFSPNPATGSSSMTVSANGFGELGTFHMIITGINENQPRSATITLTVAGFTLSVSPATSTVLPGGSTSYQVAINYVGGYAGAVHLSALGLPNGASAIFTPDTTTGNSTVTVTNTGATAGTYPVTITGTDANGVSKTAKVTLLVGPPSVASRFVPITPCRIADTRGPAGPFGGPFLTGSTTRDFAIQNSTCGIPSTALAYVLNATVVPKGTLRYLTLLPCGQPQPSTSNINSLDGRIKAVAAIVPSGTNGAVCAYASDDTDLVLDISGYFDPATNANALAFYPVTPCRLVDTRLATGPLGGPSLNGLTTRTFPILSSSCNIPATAQAYSLNYTSVPHGALGYLSTWPAGKPQPLVSTLNAPTGTNTANAAIVAAGVNGAVSVFVMNNSSDLVIDINGYFAPPGPGGLSLFPLTPCRLLDTRSPVGSAPEPNPQSPTAFPPFSGNLAVNVIGSGCGAPPSAQAFVLNATAIPPSMLSYLTLWPNGAAQPTVSTLNAIDGAVTSNLAIVPTTNGLVNAFVSNPTQLVLDIFGYFAP